MIPKVSEGFPLGILGLHFDLLLESLYVLLISFGNHMISYSFPMGFPKISNRFPVGFLRLPIYFFWYS